MSAINFVVRTRAGGSEHGTMSVDGDNAIVDVTQAHEVSLNLRQSDIRGYERVGQDLEITLADGRVLALVNYFAPGGGDSRLFISADGYLNEVTLSESDDGAIYAQYGPTAEWGKWSPSDDLIFLGSSEVMGPETGDGEEQVSMLGAGLLGGSGLLGLAGAGAAAVGAAAVIGGEDDPAKIAPTIDQDTDITLGGDDVTPTNNPITISGTAVPGSDVAVTIGDVTLTTVSGEDGTWQVVFEGDNFPSDGTHNVVVVITEPDGTETTLTGPTVIIDTTPPATDVTDGTVGAGDIVNAEDFQDGVEITGTGETGSTITVTVEGESQTTTVGDDQTWTVTFDDSTMPEGEYDTQVTVVAEDTAGNTTTIIDTIRIDTVPNDVAISTSQIEGDGVINAVEAANGVDIVGTATAGAEVVVTFQGQSETVTADANGDWTATFDGTGLASGEYDVDITATSTDVAGNVNTTTGTVHVDTIVRDFAVTSTTGGADGVISAQEATSGLSVSGTVEPGSTVTVALGGTVVDAVVADDGTWTATFAPGDIPAGTSVEDMVTTATDDAGNVQTITSAVNIDTDPNDVTISTATIEGDGVANAAEAADGVQIAGTATPNATVDVTFQGVTQQVTADDAGNWGATFDGANLTPGQYDADVTATSTDAAGNTNTTSGTIRIDTQVEDFAITSSAGGADGVISEAEAGAGLAVSGTVEPGSTVTLTLGAATVNAVVAADGSWSATFAPDQIPTGTQVSDMVATAIDAAGNMRDLTQSISVDRDANDVTITTGAIEGADGIVNAAEAADGVQIVGTATAGAQVAVTFQGVTQTVTADAITGAWTSTFDAAGLATGQYDLDVSATSTDAAGNTNTTTGTIRIDNEVQNFDVSSNAGGADGVINAAEIGAGLTVTGAGEPGMSVTVQLGTQVVNGVVAADGSWTATFAAGQIPEGTYVTQMVATATDAAGNTMTQTSDVSVDTEAGLLTLNGAQIGGDATINHVEAQAGVLVTGQALEGTQVTVTLDGVEHVVTAGAGNVWQTTYAAGEIAEGTRASEATATITDAAGNTASVQADVQIDTRVDNLGLTPPNIATGSDGQDVINNAVAQAGFDVTGTVEPGSTVTVTIDGVAQQAVVDANGNWTASFPGGALRDGEYDADLLVSVQDAAGNVSTLSDTVKVDTLVNELSRADDQFGTDTVVNAAEGMAGITLTGEVEPGSTVQVSVLGKTYTATVAADGSWTLDIPAADIPQADRDFAMQVTATDAAGNTSSINDTLSIDTIVPDQPEIVGYFREGTGYRSVTLDTPDEAVEIHQVASDGAVNQIDVHASADPFLGETDYHFLNDAGAPAKIADGSQLVVTSTDDAGNASSTYVVLDETRSSVVDIGNANLGDFQIETVDLRFGDRSELSLTSDVVEGLSDATDTLVVHGGADDKVTITGATKGGTVDVDGDSHTVYTLDDSVQVLVDDDITNVII